VAQVFTTANGARDASLAIPRVLIVVTDGKSSQTSLLPAAAAALKADLVQIFSIGIGNYNADELRAMASFRVEDHVFALDNFNQIGTIVSKISADACSAQFELGLDQLNAGSLTAVKVPVGEHKCELLPCLHALYAGVLSARCVLGRPLVPAGAARSLPVKRLAAP